MAEYICKIRKVIKDIPQYMSLLMCYRLPLFELEPKAVYTIHTGDFICFYKEDRYTPNLICVYPPKLTEEQFYFINQKWNYFIENNLSELEFEL